MFRIGEFSKLTQVSIRMLRYYDEAGLLKPEKIDPFTNYRLYSVEQIPVLNQIIFLRDLGFPVTEIAAALKHWDNEYLTKQLERKRLDIENTIKAEQARLVKLEQAKQDLQQETIKIHYNVAIKSIPAYQVFSLRRTVSDYYAEGGLWAEMSEYANQNCMSLSSNTFTIYHDIDFREKDVDIEICAPVDKAGENKDGFWYRITEPVPIMASTMVYGEFKNISGAYLAFAAWLKENQQYKMVGSNRQIVHRGPWNETNPDQYLTEIQIPLEENL